MTLFLSLAFAFVYSTGNKLLIYLWFCEIEISLVVLCVRLSKLHNVICRLLNICVLKWSLHRLMFSSVISVSCIFRGQIVTQWRLQISLLDSVLWRTSEPWSGYNRETKKTLSRKLCHVHIFILTHERELREIHEDRNGTLDRGLNIQHGVFVCKVW